MSTSTAPLGKPAAPVRPPPRGGGMVGAIAAEWTKLWSLRSTWWCIAGAAAMMALYAVSAGFDTSNPPDGAANMPRSELVMPAQDAAVTGLLLAQFALIALAVLVVTTEYATGSIRSTLQWEPRRGRVLLAKLAVLGPVLFVAGTAVALAGAALADLSAGDYGVFEATDVAQTSLRIGLYLSIAGILAASMGMILRSTAGALTTAFLLLMLLPMVLGSVGLDLLVETANYLPGTAGMELVSSAGFLGIIEPPYEADAGFAIFAGWAVAAALAGYAVLRRRDA